MKKPLATPIAAQLASLSTLKIKELWQLWDQYFPQRPKHPNREHLEARLAYKIQEAAFGGLSSETRQRLINIGRRHSKIQERRPAQEIYLAPGTVLIREFGERDHHVTVTADGSFSYESRLFKSLSAVARHITGTPWSGPAFFGLRKPGEKAV